MKIQETELLVNPHAGVILKEEYLTEMQMSQNELARRIGVPSNRIHQIVSGQRAVTADTDLRLCRFLGLSEGFFLRLQAAYNLREAKRKGVPIEDIEPYKWPMSDIDKKELDSLSLFV